jgi:hypothetical protein
MRWTAKSCLAYFHDDTAPLPASVLRTLAEQDIAVRLEVFVCARIVSTESGRTNDSKSAMHERTNMDNSETSFLV